MSFLGIVWGQEVIRRASPRWLLGWAWVFPVRRLIGSAEVAGGRDRRGQGYSGR